MTITVAGAKKEYTEGLNVSKLVELENVEMPDYVTITINDDIVERSAFKDTLLKEGDSVEFLYFMGGGCC